MALFYQLTLVTIVGALAFFAFSALNEKRRMKGAKPPPGPPGWPIVGNAPELATSNGNLIPFFNRWNQTYGPIAQFSILGEKQVVLSDDNIARDLFVRRGKKYSDRGTPHAMVVLTDNINPALMPKNDAWRRERKFIHSAMSASINKKYQGFMEEEAILAVRDLANTPADFDNHFMRYSYGVLTRSLLGFRVTSAHDDFIADRENFLLEGMKCFRPDSYPSNVFPFLRGMPTWLVPSLKTLYRLKGVVNGQAKDLRSRVESSIQDGTARDSIIREFLQNRKNYDISDAEADATFASMIGGGTRSPHNSLLSYAYLMMEFPEWLSKVQEEVDRVVGPDRLPQTSDIPDLPTVRAIVKEQIRYRSIIAELGIPHRLSEDDVYEGYFFPKGTVFHANYAAILMNKEVYPDQKLFNPARWLEPSYPTFKEPLTTYPNCQNFTPFGYGPRACPGWDFAERALVIMVAQLAWGFNVRKPRDGKGEEYLPKLEFEPVPNPRPFPFGCVFAVREGRKEVIEREAHRCE